jgi:hypothetical protein
MTKRKEDTALNGPVTFSHGFIRRPRPEEMTEWLNRPPRVLLAYSVEGHPSNVMYMVSEGMGTSSVYLDGADIQSWLSEHHPELLFKDAGGKTVFDPRAIPGDILAPCLKHARACWAEKQPRPAVAFQAYEIGSLFDAEHCYRDYARTIGAA